MNQRIQLNATISVALINHRLDQALAQLFPTYSRGTHQQWIRQGMVKVDNQIITLPRYKVTANQFILIDAQISPASAWTAEAIPLHIVYEDQDILVINKPAGLTVHPGAGQANQTLVNALLHHAPSLAVVPRAGLIHRLDKDTTGLLVIAKTLQSHQALTTAMQSRQIGRQYLAIVHGRLLTGGSIEAPIGRHPIHRTKMAVKTGGKNATTHYRIIARYRAHTLLNIRLETGRTHQIRVHFAYLKHPIVGDKTYCRHITPPQWLSLALKTNLSTFTRQALHAYQLSLSHPRTGELMHWKAPIPNDIKMLITQLEEDNAIDHSSNQ